MNQLEQELDRLRSRVVQMGELTQSMLILAIDAVAVADVSSFDPVFEAEERLDQIQLEIDEDAIQVIAAYSPVAADLRILLSVSRIAAELERIADQATNLCENLRLMTMKTDSGPIADVVKMGENVKSMVAGALRAFEQRDTQQAMTTIAADDLVDAQNDQIVKRLLQDDNVREMIIDARDTAHSLSQILIASSLERIADQATNICEEVVYMVKGSDIRHMQK
jgi:phosphate transport system protein